MITDRVKYLRETAVGQPWEECRSLRNIADELEALLKERDQLKARVGKLERALTLLYDKWENGTPCFENPEDRNGPLGNAFRLSYEEENEVLELINANEV